MFQHLDPYAGDPILSLPEPGGGKHRLHRGLIIEDADSCEIAAERAYRDRQRRARQVRDQDPDDPAPAERRRGVGSHTGRETARNPRASFSRLAAASPRFAPPMDRQTPHSAPLARSISLCRSRTT